jgi:hypothetical protein
MRVFLGGTCAGSTWREELIPILKEEGIDYFNPVVEEWTDECREKEIQERQECDACLYVISPKMKGIYSIAEAVEDAIRRPNRTVFHVIGVDGKYHFSQSQLESLIQTGKMVAGYGAYFTADLQSMMNAIRSIKIDYETYPRNEFEEESPLKVLM